MALKAVGSNLTIHPIEKKHAFACFFQLNPPLKVGEILLTSYEISLAGSEVAAAVGGFDFIVSKRGSAYIIYHKERRFAIILLLVSFVVI